MRHSPGRLAAEQKLCHHGLPHLRPEHEGAARTPAAGEDVMPAPLWEVGCFRCEMHHGPVSRLCLYHQEALLRAVTCEGDEAAAREAEELRRFVEDPLLASMVAARRR
jgi:hypothetical protein